MAGKAVSKFIYIITRRRMETIGDYGVHAAKVEFIIQTAEEWISRN